MQDFFGDRFSQLTFLLYLDDDYEGGRALQIVLAKASTFTKWEGLFVE